MSYNQELQFGSSSVTSLNTHPIDNFSNLNDEYEKNYLNVTQDDKIEALKKRYEQYEEIMKVHLRNFNIEYKRIHFNQLSADDTVVLIGFVKNVDEDSKVKIDEFAIDCLAPKGEPYSLNCFIEMDSLENEGFGMKGLQLFPMKLIAFQGVINDNQEIKVDKIFSAPCFEDVAQVKRDFSHHSEILAFSGPYHLDGSTFTALDPILNRIVESNPTLVILTGPFFDKNSEISQNPVHKNYKGQEIDFHFQKRRRHQLKVFLDSIKEQTGDRTKVAIIPDINEIDCMFPLPVPEAVLELPFCNDMAKVYSNPALITLENGLNIAVTSGDIYLDLAKASTYENVENRFIKGLETYLEQKNLMPIYPSINPVDLSKINITGYTEDNQPDILITRSSITQQLKSIRGVVCMTIQPSTGKDGFRSYGHMKVSNDFEVRFPSLFLVQKVTILERKGQWIHSGRHQRHLIKFLRKFK